MRQRGLPSQQSRKRPQSSITLKRSAAATRHAGGRMGSSCREGLGPGVEALHHRTPCIAARSSCPSPQISALSADCGIPGHLRHLRHWVVGRRPLAASGVAGSLRHVATLGSTADISACFVAFGRLAARVRREKDADLRGLPSDVAGVGKCRRGLPLGCRERSQRSRARCHPVSP